MKLHIKLDGVVVATLEGANIEHGRKVDASQAHWHGAPTIDDPHVYVQRSGEFTLWVLRLPMSGRVTAEEVPL